MKYHDIETDEVLTIDDLKTEYRILRENGETEADTFEDYLQNCLSKNGTLEIAKD